ncbi:FAD:protein FMN transferase [Qaidamihabitans albus]|uniref:FAD:protein FMN transferase n=1 Tax=Qaidamihabitans albus TaxID=2795733 RepID=UPI0018F2756F|nr:FAD:protein FMN transferase [Qaidamihabitans albus]
MRPTALHRPPSGAAGAWGDNPLGATSHVCYVFTCQVSLACRGRPAVEFGEVEARLRLLEQRFSRFIQDSELSRLNVSAGKWCPVSPEMYALLEHGLNVAVASEGLVNIAVLPQLVAAGYVSSSPEQPAVAEAAFGTPVEPLTSVLELRRGQARLRPGHAVDLGALAKGWWADEVVSWLGPNSAASLGGDVSCRGEGPTGAGWPVAVPGGVVLTVVDGAVATSGTAKRRWGHGMHHLIDPRTGRPSDSDVVEATVVANAGRSAEWVSSALVVGGTAVAGRLRARADVLDVRLNTTGES